MSEFNTIASVLGVYQQTADEARLNQLLGDDSIELVQRFVAQWSQLVAWSWLEPNDYEESEKPSEEQENLRQEFINVVKELARSCTAEHYCPGMFVAQIFEQSDRLSQYLNGTLPESGLNLHQLYLQLTQKNEDNDDYVFTENFIQHFVWVVTVDRFNGWLAGYNEGQNKFVMVLAYPPRPTLSPSVLGICEIRDWSKGLGDGGYTPPNPYIPTCLC